MEKHIFKINEINCNGFAEVFLDQEKTDRVEIPFVLPGEEVEVELYHKKKKVKRGHLHKIITPSRSRVLAKCDHYGVCGGCRLQHFDQLSYQLYKQNIFESAFKSYNLAPPKIDHFLSIGPGKRRRIDFSARKIAGEVRVGFHEMHTKNPFNTKQCPLLVKELEALFDPLRDLIAPLLESERLIHIFATRAQEGVDLLLAGFKNLPTDHHLENLKTFAVQRELARLTLKVKKQEHLLHLSQVPTVRFSKHDVPIDPHSFLQSTAESDGIFADFVTTHLSHLSRIDGARPIKVIDLFCGRGTLSLPLYDLGHKIAGYETDRSALRALKSLSLADDRYHSYERNLFDDPLEAAVLSNVHAALMNPPRAGAQAQTAQICQSSLRDLIYISCGVDGFARDTAQLLDAGFEIKQLTLLDQFHWTPHIEMLSYFKRP